MIPVLFNILFLTIPLVFFKNTSEIFEFNKIVVIYIFTILIFTAWTIKSILDRKIIFRRTILDIPLVLHLSVLLLSTLFSIDPRTSFLGYYSRFNGGLISQVCYSILYWAFVSNLNKKESLKVTYYILFSTAVAGLLAIGEHFGIYTTCGLMKLGWTSSCWVQEVQLRVFSTLGQPNWLAALIVAVIPLTWTKSIKHYLLSILLFMALIYTKSRSGLLAFSIESVVFWGLALKKHLKEFLIIYSIFLGLFYIFYLLPTNQVTNSESPNGPVLEAGGTESGVIRKYVWIGAWRIFKNNPIIGTGPETIAYVFPTYKPIEHNLTSEWDFIYNKAHNEYLNYLANTGILGFVSYVLIIIASISILINSKKYELLAGLIAILITNFFGFSVVPVSLLFFLFPAIAITSNIEAFKNNKIKLNFAQIASILLILFFAIFTIFTTIKYWYSDIVNHGDSHPSPLNLNIIRSNANSYYKQGNYPKAIVVIKKGLEIAPHDPKLYYELAIYQAKNNDLVGAVSSLKKAIELKPNYNEAISALNNLK